MTGEVLKSFLVGLGFGVDDASLSKFNRSIASASLRVTGLYAAINANASATIYTISKISEGFEQLGYEYHMIAPAINKALLLRRELTKAYEAAGINLSKTIQSAVKLNISLTRTQYAFQAVYRSVASRFFPLLTQQSDAFRNKIYANMPKIQHVLENLIKFTFKSVEATTQLGLRLWSILTRVYDFFAKLDRATEGWSTKILALIALWQLLNLGFLATPLGMLLTGFVALLALFDDFQTWKEGGKSLIDWGPYVPVINQVTKAIQGTWEVMKDLGAAIDGVILAFYRLFHLDFSGFWGALMTAGQAAIQMFKDLWEVIKLVSPAYLLYNMGANAISNLTNPVPHAPPLGVGNTNNQTNQNVQQQTSITVNGAADAGTVGKNVYDAQHNVNADMVRNLKPSVKR